jgi:nucleotide-binding universal stress UspA family protein
MKKILVPTDFSSCANNAAELALKIAQKANARVEFLHILVTPIDWVALDIRKESQYPEIKKQIGHAKAELGQWVKRAKELGITGVKVISFTQGNEEIVNHAQNHGHDLIVMGSHGASGLKELVMGSNAQKVVQEARTPVLIVKENLKKLNIRNMVFASTFLEDVHQSFHLIIDFADLMEAYNNLLYVNVPEQFEESHESESRMKSFLTRCPRGTCSINVFNAETPEKGILQFAEDRGMDLIALVTHGRKGIKGLFASSLTEKLVNHSALPVLSVNIEI